MVFEQGKVERSGIFSDGADFLKIETLAERGAGFAAAESAGGIDKEESAAGEISRGGLEI